MILYGLLDSLGATTHWYKQENWRKQRWSSNFFHDCRCTITNTFVTSAPRTAQCIYQYCTWRTVRLLIYQKSEKEQRVRSLIRSAEQSLCALQKKGVGLWQVNTGGISPRITQILLQAKLKQEPHFRTDGRQEWESVQQRSSKVSQGEMKIF